MTFGDFILTVWVVVTLLSVVIWAVYNFMNWRYWNEPPLAENEVDMTNVVEFKRKDSNE
ncbi:unknow (plasmid) [Vibrio campbellii]|nr:unknow [Vibrio campbellii]